MSQALFDEGNVIGSLTEVQDMDVLTRHEKAQEAHFLRVMVEMWMNNLRLAYMKDNGEPVEGHPLANVHLNVAPYIEEAIKDMFHDFKWGVPFEKELALEALKYQRELGRIEESNCAREKLLKQANLDTEKAIHEMENRALEQETALVRFIESMMNTDVTHAERRGQLKQLIEEIRQSMIAIRNNASDIPF